MRLFTPGEIVGHIWDDEHTAIVGYVAKAYTFSSWISGAEKVDKLATGDLFELYEDRVDGPHRIGYSEQKPPATAVTKENPNNSKSAPTDGDTLACVGLSRFRFGVVSRGRQKQARADRKERGRTPSGLYLGRSEAERARDEASLKGLSFKNVAYGYGVKRGDLPKNNTYEG